MAGCRPCFLALNDRGVQELSPYDEDTELVTQTWAEFREALEGIAEIVLHNVSENIKDAASTGRRTIREHKEPFGKEDKMTFATTKLDAFVEQGVDKVNI